MAPKVKHVDEDDGGEELFNVLRLKAGSTFVAALMVLYSFFGSIYRVPIQIEQSNKEIVALQVLHEKLAGKLSELDRLVVGRSETIAEIARLRVKIDNIDKEIAAQGVVHLQISRLDATSIDLAKQLDAVSTKLIELGINISNLKDTITETKRSLDDLKRKQP